MILLKLIIFLYATLFFKFLCTNSIDLIFHKE
jgi:hypothetical protein